MKASQVSLQLPSAINTAQLATGKDSPDFTVYSSRYVGDIKTLMQRGAGYSVRVGGAPTARVRATRLRASAIRTTIAKMQSGGKERSTATSIAGSSYIRATIYNDAQCRHVIASA